jgi:nitroreductase
MSVDETVLSLIKTRRSIRKYKGQPISDSDLKKILEAGRWAPSGANLQPWRFIVVQNKVLIKQISKVCYFGPIKSRHVGEAATVIIICGDSRSMGNTWEKDCMIAGTNMTLMATALKIGSCWIGAFNEDTIRLLVKIPAYLKIIALISLGYASHPVSPPPRLPLEEIVHYNTYSTKDVSLFKKATKSGPFSVLGRILRVFLNIR